MSAILYAMSNESNNPSDNRPVAPTSPASLTGDSTTTPVPVFAFKDKRFHKSIIIAQSDTNQFFIVHELDGMIATIQVVKAYDVLRLRGEQGNPEVDCESVWLFAYLNPNGSKKSVLLEGWSHTTKYRPSHIAAFAMDFENPYPHIASQVMRCLAVDGR
jgi:hypothetical protein